MVFVPFLGDFLSMTRISRRKPGTQRFRPLSWGLSFNSRSWFVPRIYDVRVFVPFLGDFLSMPRSSTREGAFPGVFVPFLGDFLSIACLRSPSPSALASAFAAGMRGSLHQALSFGDEMPIFPGRTGIGGDL